MNNILLKEQDFSVMRLDLFLKASRLIPRRTLAQEFCEKGLVSVNGMAAKSSKELKENDVIEITRRAEKLRVQVSKIPTVKQVSKSDAASLFHILNIEKFEDSF